MALRLSDLVVCGEIENTTHYTVTGWLKFKNHPRPLRLQLTGNCSPDLQGRRLRFQTRDAEQLEEEEGGNADDLSRSEIPANLAWQQIGPTGTMTADRQIKVAECSPDEWRQRCKLGEPPPFEWKPCLYLEWFSQNGRVVLEMPDPVLKFLSQAEWEADDADGDPEGAAWDPDDALFSELEDADDLSFFDSAALDDGSELDDDDEEEEESADDPYHLVSDELQEQLDRQAAAMDRSIRDETDDDSRSLRELELMDELIESGDGQPISTLFDDPIKLPRPEQLSDEEVEQELKRLLAQLAVFGIALDVCEHFTPRDMYRLLLDEICTEENAYPELRNTQWVQHFMTSEFCEKCDAEFEKRLENKDRLDDDDDDADVWWDDGDENP